MNYGIIKSFTKDVGSEIEKINQFTRAPADPENVYIVAMRLCDDKVDRDFERFSPNAIRKLAELFVGVTVICDHSPKMQNQTGRIYETEVIYEDDGSVSLAAKAYIPNSPKNSGIISDLEMGIVKEVSLSCAISSSTCSVCGKTAHGNNRCGHSSGREYDGKLCHFILDDPTDAYEVSFVAVPAQRAAGVTKSSGAQSVDWTDFCRDETKTGEDDTKKTTHKNQQDKETPPEGEKTSKMIKIFTAALRQERKKQ